MIKTVLKWLKRPYFYNQSNTFKIYLSIGIGFLTFFLLLVFEPVNINNKLIIHPTLFKLSIASITVLNLLFFFFIITKLFKNFFNEENWTVGRHILTVISLIVFSSIIRWFVTNFFLNENFNINISLLTIVKYSFSLGIFPVLLFTYIHEKYHFNKYNKTTKILINKENNVFVKPKITSKKITLSSTNKKDTISFKLDNLIYVTSESNYACFIIKRAGNNKEYILRKTLIDVENDLSEFNNIIRCHKSYIVNSNYIKEISGNARGYYLDLINDKKIPVSRNFKIKKLLESC